MWYMCVETTFESEAVALSKKWQNRTYLEPKITHTRLRRYTHSDIRATFFSCTSSPCWVTWAHILKNLIRDLFDIEASSLWYSTISWPQGEVRAPPCVYQTNTCLWSEDRWTHLTAQKARNFSDYDPTSGNSKLLKSGGRQKKKKQNF